MPPLPGQAVDDAGNPVNIGRGRLTLWLGFVLALGVFVAGIYGSIRVFRRQSGTR